jgi:hypothetical protein
MHLYTIRLARSNRPGQMYFDSICIVFITRGKSEFRACWPSLLGSRFWAFCCWTLGSWILLDSRFGRSVLGSSFLALRLLLAVRFVPSVLFLGVAITGSARRVLRVLGVVLAVVSRCAPSHCLASRGLLGSCGWVF